MSLISADLRTESYKTSHFESKLQPLLCDENKIQVERKMKVVVKRWMSK